MNRNILKVLSSALIFSVVLSATACKKDNRIKGTGKSCSGQKVVADSPWYDNKKIEVELGIDGNKQPGELSSLLAGYDDNYIIAYTTGSYKSEGRSNTDDNNDDPIDLITVVDRTTGGTVNQLDLNGILDDGITVGSLFFFNGTLTVRSFGYDQDLGPVVIDTDIDPLSGEITDTRKNRTEEAGGFVSIFTLGKYMIQSIMSQSEDEPAFCTLQVHSQDGVSTDVEVKKPGTRIYEISSIIPLKEDNALICAEGDNGTILFELDLTSGNITDAEPATYEWLNIDELNSVKTASDGEVYAATDNGFSRIDFENKTMVETFNYNWCAVNKTDLEFMEAIDVTCDSVVMCGPVIPHSAFGNSSSSFVIYEFTKMEKNPNNGKTMLELYDTSGNMDSSIANAIVRFNETNDKYYIVVTNRYDPMKYFDQNAEITSPDDLEKESYYAMSKLSNELTMDIMNGDGPDILLYTSAFGQLNNPEYLADLTPFIGELDPEKYFTNIIDGAKIDGKLYQLPVSYDIEGIQTDSQYAGSSGVGFTTAEYERFLSETLNGKDVITFSRAIYFQTVVSAMSDVFIKDGNVDFSCPEFRELADFVKNNVSAESMSWDIYDEEELIGSSYETIAEYGTLYGAGDYLINVTKLNGATAVLGLPSTDGRGPLFSPHVSVAVSAQAYDTEACAEFVRMLIEDDVQNELAMNDAGFVLNREAFRKGTKAAVDYYNSDEGKTSLYGYINGDFPAGDQAIFSDGTVDALENVILSCARIDSPDSSISIILIEELPAYFMDQKEFDDVVAIARDRAQKVLDERG